MILQHEITLPAMPKGFHLITQQIEKQLNALPDIGLVNIFIKHTSAALAINENADPTVQTDLNAAFNQLVPENMPFYRHTCEGPDDMPAHIKCAIVGCSLTVPITKGKLNLGTWQGIYLCEFRNNGGSRRLVLTVYS